MQTNVVRNLITTQTLNQILESGGPSAKPFATMIGRNMGNNTLLLSVPMQTFHDMSEVANEQTMAKKTYFRDEEVAQRKLNIPHAQKLAVYMLKGLFQALARAYKEEGITPPAEFDALWERIGKQPYLALQPITANIRSTGPQGDGLEFEKAANGKVIVYLADQHVLWVVDGQHRRHAMAMLFEFLRGIVLTHKYAKRPALFPFTKDELAAAGVGSIELDIWNRIYELWRSSASIMVEVHLGLTPEQERQLFHDLNNLTKKIEAGLVFKFDNSNPINLFIKDELDGENVLKAHVVETDVTDWHSDKGVIGRKDLIAVNAILFLNKTNIGGAIPGDIIAKKTLATRFWETISEIPNFGEDQAKKKTVAAQPVVLKAIAKLTYDFAFSKNPDPTALENLLGNLNQVDFSHSNPMWRYYELSQEDRDKDLPGFREYLPLDNVKGEDVGANRDIGGFDEKEGVMRFGAKHNDIYPIIGDMIRWKLKLPNRHADRVSKT
jgi:hypothetical protein